MMVEVAETLVGVPGPAVVRRWRREAPAGFTFTALAPREITAEGFKKTSAAQAGWARIMEFATEMGARGVVVSSPGELAHTKATRAAARALLETLAPPQGVALVWEPPAGWELRDAEAAVKDLAVVVARDPLRHSPATKAKLAYYRLPGPAGHRSRYEDPALEQVATTIRGTRAEQVLVVFANVDMYADSKRLRRLLDGAA
jgi:uncharacterized protein YecE (DUF72 family)